MGEPMYRVRSACSPQSHRNARISEIPRSNNEPRAPRVITLAPTSTTIGWRRWARRETHRRDGEKPSAVHSPTMSLARCELLTVALFALLLLASSSSAQNVESSWRKAKNASADNVYHDNDKTLYCG